jgi:hypothetical protein
MLIVLTLFAGNPLVKQLPAILAACAALGAVWAVYQLLRYENRPGLYLLDGNRAVFLRLVLFRALQATDR